MSERPGKVLFFSHQAEYLYGGEIVTLEFMRELAARGVEVHFASPRGPYEERAHVVGAKTHLVSSRQFSRRVAQLPGIAASFRRARSELRAIVAAEKIEVLHATSLKAMALAWGLSVPTLWHHHDILPAGLANDLWVRALAARAARILAPSEATRGALLRAGVGAEKVKVLRNGFRTEEWASRPPQKPDHLFRIGLVGEISRRKGSDRLEALVGALGNDPGLQFLVIGEGLSEPDFAAALKDKLASRQVRFLGKRTRMKELYQELDVLFVPSRQDPLPTVIVEAGLSGVPVVGAASGGIPEMIEQGRNGFLYDPETAGEAEAAARILAIREEWPRFHAQARELAEGRYDIRRLTDELLAHYRGILR